MSRSEYYPYGMEITGLSWNTGNNRYGFGGTHEMDNEVKGGVGNHLSFGDFGYDTRVARRFNLDPIDQIFISNYAGFYNNPISIMDPSGYSGGEFGDPNQFNEGICSDEVIVEADRDPAPNESGTNNSNNESKPSLGEKLVKIAKDALNTFVTVGEKLAKDLQDNGNGKFLGATAEQWGEAAVNVTPVVGSFNSAVRNYNEGDYLAWFGWTTMSAAEAITLGGAYYARVGVFGAKTVASTAAVKVATEENIVMGTSLVTKYPAIAKIEGTVQRVFLMPNQVIDRYGELTGRWFSVPSVPFSARTLPPGQGPYTKFIVLKPFEVEASIATPGFFSNQFGFGLQYFSPVSASTLIEKGIIKPIP